MPKTHLKEKHDHATLKFPDGFLWGAATSAHQVEGNNIHNDWWEWEQKREPRFRSGLACNQYELYEQDFDLAKSLNHNAHRLSIEWSRIEPEEGKFDIDAIEHYRAVFKSLKARKMAVCLTLWHFTLPAWLAQKGGWENLKAPFYFERFLKKVIPEIGEFVDLWITLNEPEVYIYELYIEKVWPGAKKSWWAQVKTQLNLARAHKKAYKLVHKIYPNSKVGIANNVQSIETFHKHSLIEQLSVIATDLTANHLFYVLTKGTHDFLGLNYYFHTRLKEKDGLLPEIINAKDEGKDISDLGWEVYPEGIFDILTDFKNHLPIYITECGIASTNDDRRNRFLVTYLSEVYRAIQAGVNVRGFFYWSLLDNFEWHRGFEPRFGLVEVDYASQKRHLRTSALTYAEIIAANGIPHSLMRFIGHTVTAEEVLKDFDKREMEHGK
ncbi:glycoside hydrolase family 1 protein [Candidatus Daviesbacteria bacterium]|nr:glycoside hydrolase family 1 protein [Candidatus Daviesbacteria bacterium]